MHIAIAHNEQVVFPSNELTLNTAETSVLLEFDLGLIAVMSSISHVISAKLRVFVVTALDGMSISVSKMEGDLISDGEVLQVTSEGQWIDVDVLDAFDGSSHIHLVLTHTNGVIARPETCHSPKLIVVTSSESV